MRYVFHIEHQRPKRIEYRLYNIILGDLVGGTGFGIIFEDEPGRLGPVTEHFGHKFVNIYVKKTY